MANESRTQLKTYFQTGDIPTQSEFENLIDSSVNRTDDKVVAVAEQECAIGFGGAVSPDATNCKSFYVNLTSSAIISGPLNMVSGETYTFRFLQTAGSETVSFRPEYIGSFAMPSGVGDISIVEGYCDGTNIYLKDQKDYV